VIAPGRSASGWQAARNPENRVSASAPEPMVVNAHPVASRSRDQRLTGSRSHGWLPGWSGQDFEQSGGVDACGEAEKSLRQFAGGFHGGVVADAVE